MSVQPELSVKSTMPAFYRGVYDPVNTKAYSISRSKIDLFMTCQRCAYLDMRLDVKRPPGPPFTLNNAVDELFKREFDVHRANGTTHPLCETYGIDAVPFQHEKIDSDDWRDFRKEGVFYLHTPTNLLVKGWIDDIWITKDGQLIVVDYKATSKKVGPSSENDLYDSYKHQMEVYQWLFKMSGFKVSPTGYFVYANGKSDAKAFDAKLEFDVKVIGYAGDDSWIEPALVKIKEALVSDVIPPVGKSFFGDACEFCTYSKKRTEITLKAMDKKG